MTTPRELKKLYVMCALSLAEFLHHKIDAPLRNPKPHCANSRAKYSARTLLIYYTPKKTVCKDGIFHNSWEKSLLNK